MVQDKRITEKEQGGGGGFACWLAKGAKDTTKKRHLINESNEFTSFALLLLGDFTFTKQKRVHSVTLQWELWQ